MNETINIGELTNQIKKNSSDNIKNDTLLNYVLLEKTISLSDKIKAYGNKNLFNKNLKDNFKHEKTINYEIESIPKVPFGIKIAYNTQILDLQKEFDDSEDTMYETLRKAYDFLSKI